MPRGGYAAAKASSRVAWRVKRDAVPVIGNTGLATTTGFKRQAHAEYEQGRNRVGSARIRAPIVRFCAGKVASRP